jgi:HAD superfamily hydrolase (TIGR01509 family)
MAERAFIFDLDGTVWDSWPLYAFTLAELSGQPPDQLLGALKKGESVAQLHKRLGISRARFVDRATRDAQRLQVYDRVGDVLATLKEAGNALGVVTGLPGSIANPLLALKGLSQLFDQVVPATFGLPAKPSPNGLHVWLRGLGHIEPGKAIYVGDTASDAEAARAAGTRFAWASYGYGKGPIEHDLLLERPADLLANEIPVQNF